MATRQASKFPDTSGLSPAEMLAFAEQLKEEAAAGVNKQFEENINYMASNAKSLSKTLTDVAVAVVKLMDKAERDAFVAAVGGIKSTRAPKGSAVKGKLLSEDKDGLTPEMNTTYIHPKTKQEWTKLGHRVPNAFIALVDQDQGGTYTWADLRKKK